MHALTNGISNKGQIPLDSPSTFQRRIRPLPAPEAARSLLLQAATELTQESADEETLSGFKATFPAKFDASKFRFMLL